MTWLRSRGVLTIASGAAALWTCIWGVAVAWLVVSYRGNLASHCPPGSEYEFFCRGHLADQLLADLVRIGAVFLVGALVIGGATLLGANRRVARDP